MFSPNKIKFSNDPKSFCIYFLSGSKFGIVYCVLCTVYCIVYCVLCTVLCTVLKKANVQNKQFSNTQFSLHIVLFTYSSLYTQFSLQIVLFTHSSLHTQFSLHIVLFTHSSLCTQFSLHIILFTHSSLYTQFSLHLFQVKRRKRRRVVGLCRRGLLISFYPQLMGKILYFKI